MVPQQQYYPSHSSPNPRCRPLYPSAHLTVALPNTLQARLQIGSALRPNVNVVDIKDGPEHKRKVQQSNQKQHQQMATSPMALNLFPTIHTPGMHLPLDQCSLSIAYDMTETMCSCRPIPPHPIPPPEEAPAPLHLAQRQVVLAADIEVADTHKAILGQVGHCLVNDGVKGRDHCIKKHTARS